MGERGAVYIALRVRIDADSTDQIDFVNHTRSSAALRVSFPTPLENSSTIMVAGSSPSAYAQARELIDDVHRRDPRYVKRREAHAAAGAAGAAAAGLDVVGGAATAAGTGVEGDADSAGGQLDDEGQDELAYADAMEAWVNALVNKVGPSAEDRLASLPGGRDLVRIAARCQHLERFATPRSSFPDGKAGYLQWRRSLYHTQADHAARLMAQAGMADDECRLVRTWVSKTDLKPGKSGGEWGTQVRRGRYQKSEKSVRMLTMTD